MDSNKTHHRGRTALVCFGVCICMAILVGRLFFLMIFRSDYYYAMAEDLHQRERTIKAARGEILDRNGAVIAANRTVCTVSVVHNQLTDPERVVEVLSAELGLPAESVREKVENILPGRL